MEIQNDFLCQYFIFNIQYLIFNKMFYVFYAKF